MKPETPDVVLNLLLPADLEEMVEDCLLAHPQRLLGFVTSEAAGHGIGSGLNTAREQVSGHDERRRLEVFCRQADAEALVQALTAALPQAQIYYWLTPVLARGWL
ncbi:MAG: hypothetical protein RIR00_479 [Pseudomonadota bacterium]|jgi:hypothetical protein